MYYCLKVYLEYVLKRQPKIFYYCFNIWYSPEYLDVYWNNFFIPSCTNLNLWSLMWHCIWRRCNLFLLLFLFTNMWRWFTKMCLLWTPQLSHNESKAVKVSLNLLTQMWRKVITSLETTSKQIWSYKKIQLQHALQICPQKLYYHNFCCI
jgi:hypothetical protein